MILNIIYLILYIHTMQTKKNTEILFLITVFLLIDFL